VNILPNAEYQETCETFINERGLELVANDYNADPARGPVQTNAVHDLFQNPYLKPVFLVINCVSNSFSHLQWSLLVNTCCPPNEPTVNQWLDQWRTTIDAVQAPAPLLTDVRWSGGTFEFTFPGQRGRTNSVEYTTNCVNWTVATNASGSTGPIIFRDTNARTNRNRLYRVRRL
jgi:hypothetical protein